MKIGSTSYTAIAELGSGTEGVVYLAKNGENQVVTLKIFNDLQTFQNSKKLIADLTQRGINTVPTIDEDPSQLVVVQKYIFGVPMSELFKESQADSQIKELYDSLRLEVKNIQKASSGTTAFLHADNIFFDLKSQKLIVIDPH